MRLPPHLLAAVVLSAPAGGSAQTPAPPRWEVAGRLESVRFSRGLVDAAASSDVAAGLRPSSGVGVSLALARRGANWTGEVTSGWAGLRPQADNQSVAVLDRTTRLTRLRLAGALERRLFGIGTGSLALGAGPALDWWRVAGQDRARLGAAAHAALRVPLGSWVFENRLGVGISGSPFLPEDVGESYETRALVSVTLGVALHAPL